LSGAGEGTILDHLVRINAESYTTADDDLIPTGEIADVAGLPVDFTNEMSVGSRLEQMQLAKFTGYDLNYVFDRDVEGSLIDAARITDPSSGRIMEVFTTQPCMHFYTSNFLSGEQGKQGIPYEQYGAVCFEPQGFPDAPHHRAFLPVELEPGNTYDQRIIYRFSHTE
ncbi:MAG: galactose-1-epimerase, partial [Anaerolineales bacterium]|nr:galactose-1-epimerase [Anaerolineales bacterium]